MPIISSTDLCPCSLLAFWTFDIVIKASTSDPECLSHCLASSLHFLYSSCALSSHFRLKTQLFAAAFQNCTPWFLTSQQRRTSVPVLCKKNAFWPCVLWGYIKMELFCVSTPPLRVPEFSVVQKHKGILEDCIFHWQLVLGWSEYTQQWHF